MKMTDCFTPLQAELWFNGTPTATFFQQDPATVGSLTHVAAHEFRQFSVMAATMIRIRSTMNFTL
jgi:hypothetical protein